MGEKVVNEKDREREREKEKDGEKEITKKKKSFGKQVPNKLRAKKLFLNHSAASARRLSVATT